MTFDLSIIFDIPECQYFAALRCHVAFAFKIRNHRALRCKERCVASKANVAFAFKIRNHRALRFFLYLSATLHATFRLKNTECKRQHPMFTEREYYKGEPQKCTGI